MLTPALRVAEAAAYKQDPYGNAQPTASLAKILKQQLVGSTPEALLVNRLRSLGYFKTIGVNPAQSKVDREIARALRAKVITSAEAAALRKAAAAAPSKKMFPTTFSEALGMPLAGSWWPRVTNAEQLHKQAAKEMTPAERLHFELEQAVTAHVLTRAEAKQLEARARP